LAKEGFTGAENVFAGRYGFFPMYQPDGYELSIIDQDLGKEYVGDRISFKPYPCVRPSHAFIDAAIKLHHELELGKNEIESVVVRMDAETLDSRYNLSAGIARPSHQVEAQFSVRYLIGCALALGGVGIDEINIFTNPVVLAASELVTSESKPGAAKGWAEIEVVCVGGKTAAVELESPFGSPDNPLSIEQLKDKFRDCAAHAIHPTPKANVEKMITMILNPDALADSVDLIKLSLVTI
jgi:2-methylcitrate dehydratase PrpD